VTVALTRERKKPGEIEGVLPASVHKAKKFQVDSAGAPGFSPGTPAKLFCWGDVGIQE